MSLFRFAAPWTLASWGLLVCALAGYVRFVTVADSRGVPSGPTAQVWPAPNAAGDEERMVVAARPAAAPSRAEVPADAPLAEAAVENAADLAPQTDQRLR